MSKLLPDFEFEHAAQARGFSRIAGVDEVGRGPLAGPVFACAVVLNPAQIPEGLGDSKTLSARKRDLLFERIMAVAEVGIGEASVEEIDEHNILRASHIAMNRAIAALSQPIDHALIDGNLIPRDICCSAEAIVKGDARSLSVAAASIVAKVTRDRLMAALDAQYPGYGWAKNAGYPTKDHMAGLLNLGVTPVHRRSFKPVHNILYQAENPNY